MDKQQLIELREKIKRGSEREWLAAIVTAPPALTVDECEYLFGLLEQEQKEHQNYCKSCNEPMSNDCKRCEKLWSS